MSRGLNKAPTNERSLLLADIREYLGRGQSLYLALLREGVPKDLTMEILPVINAREAERGDSPLSIEIPGIATILLDSNE
jgi:hypothetical protein